MNTTKNIEDAIPSGDPTTAMDVTPTQRLAVWAERLIGTLSDTVSAADLGRLRQQMASLKEPLLTVSVTKVAEPTVPLIVRNVDDLAKVATKVAGANDVVIDLETSDLDPRKGVIVGVGLAVGDGTVYIPVNPLRHRIRVPHA